jgi:hypothetical protein
VKKTCSHRPATAALALCALLAAGCSTTGMKPIRGGSLVAAPPYTFTIQFTNVETDPTKAARICPSDASMEESKRNCDYAKKDCVKANRGEQVVFDGVPGAGVTAVPPFAIHFDPFKGAPLPLNGSKATLNIDPEAPLQSYYFYVTSPGCPVLDPVIIVTR